jgi:hypothetical protein
MCLDTVISREAWKPSITRTGYVFMVKLKKGYSPEICYIHPTKMKRMHFKPNKWYSSTSKKITVGTYPRGFHVWTKIQNARAWGNGCYNGVIVKVKVRSIVAVGEQFGGCKVLVADERMILHEVD